MKTASIPHPALVCRAFALWLALLAGCGPDAPSTDLQAAETSYGAQERRPVRRPTLDLAAGGSVLIAPGAEIEALPRTSSGEASFTASVRGATGAVADGATVVTREYDITSVGYEPATAVVPLLVTLPVDPARVPAQARSVDFIAQTWNADKGAWVSVKGFPYYDPAAKTVSFQTGHLSTWRVIRRPFDDESGSLAFFRYVTDHFYIEYAMPKSFGDPTNMPPWADADWRARGGVRRLDPAVPDYVEDVAATLEAALTFHRNQRGTNGQAVFSGPPAGTLISVQVTNGFDGAGDSALGGPLRIKSRLENLQELRLTAAHELAHVLQAEHYASKVGAWMNRWFVEASATYYSVLFAQIDRPTEIDYYGREWSGYLRSSLDSGTEGSSYPAADFLRWLEARTGRKLVSDVLLADWTWDISALSSLLRSGSDSLSTHYDEYAFGALVGTYDLQPGDLWRVVRFTPEQLYAREMVAMGRLSSVGFELRGFVPADGLLVARNTAAAPSPGWRTYTAPGLASLPSRASTLEASTPAGRPVVVKHFGKTGTPGAVTSVVRQAVVNSNETGLQTLTNHDFYLLLPPVISGPVAPGRVNWTFTPPRHEVGARGTSYAFEPIAGFNVYADGRKLNDELIPPNLRAFSDARIGGISGLQVSVVDDLGNEWPERPPPVGAPTIVSLSPSSGGPGTTVTIAGSGFGTPDAPWGTSNYNLRVGGVNYGLGDSWSGTRIVFTLGNVQPGTVEVVVTSGGVASAPATFTVTANCEVKDATTGLTWTRDGNPAGAYKTYANAQAWAASTALCGRSGWRLPTQSELLNSDELLRNSPFVNNQGSYWTSTTCNTAGSGHNLPGHVIVFVGDGSSFCARDDIGQSTWPVHP